MNNRARLLQWVAPALLLAALAVGWIVPSPDAVRLGTPDPSAADQMTAALETLPDDARVLVAFDPALGTYAEVRPTVRALLPDLIDRGARLAFVSLTAEGRALAVSDLSRLDREGGSDVGGLRDLGFVAGAEAALVDLAVGLPDRHDAVVVVGGNDLGPRSWVEQVLPRAGGMPMLAVTPAILLPEVRPYLASGQLDAALITPGEGAAYRGGLELDASTVIEAREPSALAILVGMLAALAVLGQALGARAVTMLRAGRARDAA